MNHRFRDGVLALVLIGASASATHAQTRSYQPSFFISGSVQRPGEYPYRSGLNLISAVTAAGGFTYRASHTSVLIQHAGEGLWREYPLSTSVAISPGDLIRIPERYF